MVSVVFATAALVALSQGVLLLPGLLLMLFAVREFKPPRLLAITDVAVLTYAQSILGNGPTKLVGQGPLIPFPPSTARSVKVVIGEETIVLERKEYTLLVELSNRAVESRPAPMSPAASSLTF